MAAGSATFHESEEHLRPATRDMHRAIISFMEELEAIDWYQQRVDATGDDELREILAHNRDEEKEHAAMLLEWIRRRDSGFNDVLKTYLFTEGKITELESAVGGTTPVPGGNGATTTAPGVGLGSLRGGR